MTMRYHFHLLSSVLLILSFLAQAGCTHRQLRYDNVMQARTLTTIYEQQVLDNLAMFSQSPDSLPFFAVPGAGSASVTDSGGIAASPLNGPIRTIIGPLQLGRGNTQTWALIPITDPDKLERMQLLYQDATASGIAAKSSKKRGPVAECDLKGNYCGCSIQVCGSNRAAFTRLTLQIIDAAVNDPPTPTPEQTVEVQDIIYQKEGGLVQQTRKYNVKAEDLGPVPSSSGVQMGSGGSSSRILTAPPSSIVNPPESKVRTQIQGTILEQQKQILRGAAFPNL
jgi:hypothetical protein